MASWFVCYSFIFKNKADTELEVGGLLLTLGLVGYFPPFFLLTVAVPSSLLLPPSCGRQWFSTFLPRSESVLCIQSPRAPSFYSQSEFWEVLENPDTQVCTHKVFPVIVGCVGF